MSKRANGEGSWKTSVIKGKKYQTFSITIDGKRKSFYGKTKKEALEKYKKSLDIPIVEKDYQTMSFSDYCVKWLWEEKKKKVKPKTFDYYETIINRYIVGTELGRKSIRKLNNLQFKDYTNLFKDHLYSYQDKSKSTLDGIHTVLSQVCKYGVLYQDFANNFMEGVEKLSEKEVGTKKKNVTALNYSEVTKLWDEMLRKNEDGNIINNKPGTYVYSIGAYALLFCCFTGLRWGEVSALRWEDIKEEDGNYYFKVDKQYIIIKNREEDSDSHYKHILSDPKSEKSNRYIPLTGKAIEILDMVKSRYPYIYKPEHLIFSTTDNPYNASTANRLLKAMCIRAGVPVVSPHALRHSFASILLNEDQKNLYAVSDLLGHSSSDVTYKRYIDIFEKSKVNAMNIFDKIKK